VVHSQHPVKLGIHGTGKERIGAVRPKGQDAVAFSFINSGDDFINFFLAYQPVIAEKVGEVSVPSVPNGLLTSGAISPDAKRVIMCDYSAGYELNLRGGGSFDEIWKTKPLRVDLGDRKHGEAVTFSADGKSIVGTNEGKKAEIFEFSPDLDPNLHLHIFSVLLGIAS